MRTSLSQLTAFLLPLALGIVIAIGASVHAWTGPTANPPGNNVTLSLLGQWSASGSSLYYNGGNVGVGAASPAYKLDVQGALRATQYIWNAGVNWTMPDDNSEMSFDFANASGNAFWQVWDPTHGTILAVRNNGNVGIGTTNPATKLQVVGTGSFSTVTVGSATLQGDGNLYMPWAGQWLSTYLSNLNSGKVASCRVCVFSYSYENGVPNWYCSGYSNGNSWQQMEVDQGGLYYMAIQCQ